MPPTDIDLPGRDEARDAARRELDRAAYDEAQPSWTVRLIQWILDQLAELFLRATASVPGGRIGVVLILLLVGVLAAVAVAQLRPTTRAARTGALFDAGRTLTADEHRALADAAAAEGDFAEAVRERLRAVVRQLEERGVLDPRPGRTAAEISQEAGRSVPGAVEALRRAAITFERIWYGGQAADASSYAVLVEVDATVTRTRVAAR